MFAPTGFKINLEHPIRDFKMRIIYWCIGVPYWCTSTSIKVSIFNSWFHLRVIIASSFWAQIEGSKGPCFIWNFKENIMVVLKLIMGAPIMENLGFCYWSEWCLSWSYWKFDSLISRAFQVRIKWFLGQLYVGFWLEHAGDHKFS